MTASHHRSDETHVVAVLGLGAMGLPMAANLGRAFPVRAFDIDMDRVRLAADAGAVPCDSAREAVVGADVALVAVRTQEQFEALLWGEAGIASALRPNAVVLLTSTIGASGVVEIADRLSLEELHLVDAPVSGGPGRAATGELLTTVGASDEAWGLVAPVLEVMSGTLTRVGSAPGAGQSMKTVNQLLCGVHIAAAAEALALAEALGLDTEAALETLMAGAAASFMLGDRGPRALMAYGEGGAEVRGRLDIFVKDLGIVTAAARAVGLATPVAAAAEQLFLIGQAQGKGASDDSAIITVVAPEGVGAAGHSGASVPPASAAGDLP